jgi:hypothetical protein
VTDLEELGEMAVEEWGCVEAVSGVPTRWRVKGREEALVPVGLAERGRDQEGNQVVLVGALVARGIDSMLVFSWPGLLV